MTMLAAADRPAPLASMECDPRVAVDGMVTEPKYVPLWSVANSAIVAASNVKVTLVFAGKPPALIISAFPAVDSFGTPRAGVGGTGFTTCTGYSSTCIAPSFPVQVTFTG